MCCKVFFLIFYFNNKFTLKERGRDYGAFWCIYVCGEYMTEHEVR